MKQDVAVEWFSLTPRSEGTLGSRLPRDILPLALITLASSMESGESGDCSFFRLADTTVMRYNSILVSGLVNWITQRKRELGDGERGDERGERGGEERRGEEREERRERDRERRQRERDRRERDKERVA